MNLCSEFFVLHFAFYIEGKEGGMDSGSAVFFLFLSFFFSIVFFFFFRCSRRTYRYSKLSPVTIPRMTGPFFGS